MPNYPGPYEIEFEVNMGAVTPARTHVIRVNCAIVGTPAPGTLPSAITVQKAGGGTGTLQAVADQWWSFVRQFYLPSVTCTSFTLWKYISGTFSKDFISAGAVANPAGTGGGSTVIAGQVTLSFRTANGSVIKQVFIETGLAGDTRTTLVPNAAGNSVQKFAAYLLSADNVALGRDDSYPVAALRDSRGQNEKVWRSIYRN